MEAPKPEIEKTLSPTKVAMDRKSEETQVVRPERNLDKWPIWEPSNSRNAPKARLIQREVRLPDGSKAVATVEVGFTNKGPLTTEDQKTCYALIKYWEDKGRPEGPVYFSRQQLAKILRRSWGSRVNSSLTASLMRLRFTPFTWERSYFDSTTRDTVERIDTFNILSDLHLTRRSTDGPTTSETSYFQFNERMLKNLLAHYTRPVFLDTILSFKSEIAQILYTHLDLVLSDKNHYERRTKELFDDLGLEGTAYRYPSKRAQMLEPALKELQGAAVPTGHLTQVGLEKTVDGQDFKIVVRKGRPRGPKPGAKQAAQAALFPQELPPVVAATKAAAPAPTPEPAPKEEAEKEQVRHFYQVFFKSGETSHPTPREISQAQDHLHRLGEERARYLVTFAYRESKQTRFHIQSYGGILQYEGRAMAEYEEHARKRAEALQQKARKSHEDRFWEAYMGYLRETYARRENAASRAFSAFLEAEENERKKFTKGPLANNPAMKRAAQMFEEETTRLKRFAEHFREASGEDRVFSFWEWDETVNPERFPNNRAQAMSDVRQG
jgi:hypothetical protein